jgi:ABC-type nitrate/sulfonate/bicarbonate transport system substrate-binding protein
MTRLLALAAMLFLALPAAAQDRLRLGYPAGMNGQIVTILEKANLAASRGLEVEYTFFQNGPPMMEAFAAGQLDVAVTSLMPLATFAARLPGQAVIVSGLGHSSYGLLVKAASPVAGLSDLKGRRVAVSFGSDSHLDLLASLAEAGIDPATGVELLNIQPAELPVALEKDHADAILIRQPQVLRLQQSLGARLIKSWPHTYVVLARADYLEKHPGAIRSLVGTLADSVAYIRARPEQAAEWFGDKLRVDAATVRQVSAENPLIASPHHHQLGVTPDLRATTARWMAEAHKWGLIKTPVDAGRLFLP